MRLKTLSWTIVVKALSLTTVSLFEMYVPESKVFTLREGVPNEFPVRIRSNIFFP